ncbi:LytTR family DNA-binding domain-containing protein [Gilvimarinus sp. SDUM040013]|uniref:LytTR family DNA-binding domain-containing protein n=1 Tax=Gilvimarinus gilvus TaxID=3058038 RepID=A0ABU4S259_9GAMM|nr:LytTR family DNA-binding domain-containing protein [Gilvimarinus sp. SDUM040013]MDO3384409.1 LytTR family DNA-binding domain-containing protein [Gilvimarinus sp. SDUM040013]MDX6851014.1 LytTR family DNA-binding domain-containing protein [Gilvimarinus sp. SDUM040013]
MEVLIVDDEPLARSRLMRMLEGLEEYHVAGEAADARQALLQIERLDPDIVLLDIEMPGPGGLTVAQQIEALEDPPAVIFCTAYEQYALDAFSTSAVGYLLKPVRQGQLQQALAKITQLNKIQRAAATNEHARTSITAKTHRGMERIPVANIRYFLADQKYVTVYHTQGQHLLDTTLKELEEEFAGQMIRVHRNALVVCQFIEALERTAEGGYQVRLSDIDTRPVVSRRHASEVKALLQSL